MLNARSDCVFQVLFFNAVSIVCDVAFRDTMHATCAGGTGVDVPCGTLSGRGIDCRLAVPAACNTTSGTSHGTMYSS